MFDLIVLGLGLVYTELGSLYSILLKKEEARSNIRSPER